MPASPVPWEITGNISKNKGCEKMRLNYLRSSQSVFLFIYGSQSSDDKEKANLVDRQMVLHYNFFGSR